jgi:hypothetical protein
MDRQQTMEDGGWRRTIDEKCFVDTQRDRPLRRLAWCATFRHCFQSEGASNELGVLSVKSSRRRGWTNHAGFSKGVCIKQLIGSPPSKASPSRHCCPDTTLSQDGSRPEPARIVELSKPPLMQSGPKGIGSAGADLHNASSSIRGPAGPFITRVCCSRA